MENTLQTIAQRRLDHIQALVYLLRATNPREYPIDAQNYMLDAADELEKLIGKIGP